MTLFAIPIAYIIFAQAIKDNIIMATLILKVDNDAVLNNLKSILKLIKGVTIIPTVSAEEETGRPLSKTKDISGIGGAWASKDFPTSDEIHAMRKSSHKIPEL